MGLESWMFLEGRWKARAVEEDSFGEEGVFEGDNEFKVDLGARWFYIRGGMGYPIR